MSIVFLTIVLVVLGVQTTFAGFADDREECEYQVLIRTAGVMSTTIVSAQSGRRVSIPDRLRETDHRDRT